MPNPPYYMGREAFPVCVRGLRLPLRQIGKCPPASLLYNSLQRGGKQARKLYGMSKLFTGLIQRIFIRYFSFTKPPQNECISFYIGKTTEEIIRLHKDCLIENSSSLIEIRLTDATLTCEIHKDVCIDARLFRDEELVCEFVFFESNQLKN
ncbi:MAG: hypothetical protein E6772_17855 [Dysgonomonas sp.]|nr:hypothetical protein [Dysgonomonas sp.]